MIFLDTLALDASSAKTTAEGYRAVRARAARSGVYDYLGVEIDPEGKKFKPTDTVKVYRPEDEVFSSKSMHSFIGKPITDGHPSEPVTADNWSKLSKGFAAGAVRDGQYVAFDLLFMDAKHAEKAFSTDKELSLGYSVDLTFEDGIAPDGTAYQAVQRDIRGNHIASVKAGRAGSECRIADSAMLCDSADRDFILHLLDGDKTVATKTIVHDGISIEFADQAADAYNSIKAKLATATADIAKLTADHATAIAAKDTELAQRDATIDGLKAKVLDAAALDAAVTKRADLIATAKAIHDADYTGKSELDIRKAVLVAKGVSLDGKSEAYIDARFDVLAEDAKSSGRVIDAISSGVSKPTGFSQQTVDAAAAKSVVDMNAWRNQA